VNRSRRGQKRLRERIERKRAKKAQKAKAKNASSKGPHRGLTAPTAFHVPYRTPEALRLLGPVIRAHWMVPDNVAASLKARGREVPGPVHGEMLVDTGASTTCITRAVADELGLQPIGVKKTMGSAGVHENELFTAKLSLGITDQATGVQTWVTMKKSQAIAIPTMGSPPVHVFEEGESKAVRLIGLLGRDFLQHTTFTYYGSLGRLEVHLDLASIKAAIDRQSSGTMLASDGKRQT